MSKLNKTMI